MTMIVVVRVAYDERAGERGEEKYFTVSFYENRESRYRLFVLQWPMLMLL